MQPIINEIHCKVTVPGSPLPVDAKGAFVDETRAFVYIELEKGSNHFDVTDWHGEIIGHGESTGAWKQTNIRTTYWVVSVRFKIEANNTWYQGRFAPDYGNFCKARRMKDQNG